MTDCNCGWGGVHDPDNPKCAANQATVADHTEDRDALARVIWTTSRADESTISATGANIVADAILASDWLAAVVAEAERKGAEKALRDAAADVPRAPGDALSVRDWLRARADRYAAGEQP